MILRSVILSIGLAISCGPILAQQAMAPRDFLNSLTGLTAWFNGESGLVGIEHFHGDDTSTWLRRDGSCTQGVITVRDAQVCFTYEDDPDRAHCWYPIQQDDVIGVLSAQAEGAMQTITRTSRAPLFCALEGAGV